MTRKVPPSTSASGPASTIQNPSPAARPSDNVPQVDSSPDAELARLWSVTATLVARPMAPRWEEMWTDWASAGYPNQDLFGLQGQMKYAQDLLDGRVIEAVITQLLIYTQPGLRNRLRVPEALTTLASPSTVRYATAIPPLIPAVNLISPTSDSNGVTPRTPETSGVVGLSELPVSLKRTASGASFVSVPATKRQRFPQAAAAAPTAAPVSRSRSKQATEQSSRTSTPVPQAATATPTAAPVSRSRSKQATQQSSRTSTPVPQAATAAPTAAPVSRSRLKQATQQSSRASTPFPQAAAAAPTAAPVSRSRSQHATEQSSRTSTPVPQAAAAAPTAPPVSRSRLKQATQQSSRASSPFPPAAAAAQTSVRISKSRKQQATPQNSRASSPSSSPQHSLLPHNIWRYDSQTGLPSGPRAMMPHEQAAWEGLLLLVPNVSKEGLWRYGEEGLWWHIE